MATNMKINKNSRLFQGTNNKTRAVAEAGVELVKHHLFATDKKKVYQEFAESANQMEDGKIIPFSVKAERYNKAVDEQALKMSNLNVDEIGAENLMNYEAYRTAKFAIVSETLTAVVPDIIKQEFVDLAEFKSVNWGDTLKFTIGSNGLFVVSKLADGIGMAEPQRLRKSDVILDPENRAVTIQEDLIKILTNTTNLAEWMVRVALSLTAEISKNVYDALINNVANLPANLVDSGYTQAKFIQMAEETQGINGGLQVIAMGTKQALGNVLPLDSGLKYGLGEDYVSRGFLGTPFGIPTMEIKQRIDPATGKSAIPNNKIWFVPVSSKLVKIGQEGSVIVNQKNGLYDNADGTVDYTIMMKYDVSVVTGLMYAELTV